jgi:hypothetical protein
MELHDLVGARPARRSATRAGGRRRRGDRASGPSERRIDRQSSPGDVPRLTLRRLAAARGDWTVARRHALAHLDACADGGHAAFWGPVTAERCVGRVRVDPAAGRIGRLVIAPRLATRSAIASASPAAGRAASDRCADRDVPWNRTTPLCPESGGPRRGADALLGWGAEGRVPERDGRESGRSGRSRSVSAPTSTSSTRSKTSDRR